MYDPDPSLRSGRHPEVTIKGIVNGLSTIIVIPNGAKRSEESGHRAAADISTK